MELMYVVITSVCMTACLGVEYSDLVNLGVACQPSDTCERRPGLRFSDTNCECDRSCRVYNDCCPDGPKPTRTWRPKKKSGLTCLPFKPHEGVYARSVCKRSWNGPRDVKRKCEDKDDLGDPLMSTPVTDAERKTTYRNRYCLTCNDVASASLTYWDPVVSCISLGSVNTDYKNISAEFILENIVRVNDKWGVYHWNKSSSSTAFFPCELSFSLPVSAKKHVRFCRANVVSTCDPLWQSELAKKECESYMAVVYVEGQGYRNVHCAICNRAPIDKAKCLPGADDIWNERMSFTILLDIKGEAPVRTRKKCSSDDMVFDVFLKRCVKVRDS